MVDAEDVVEIALEKLISLSGREVGLLLGFNEEMEKLESMFTAIKATLQDAEEKQFSDRAIKDWLRKLKDVAYKLDDIMDECVYEALRLEHQGLKCGLSDTVQCSCLSFSYPKHVCFRYKIAKKMKRISERLKQIDDERTKFHLTPTVPERTSGVPGWRQTMSIITEPKVYGREEDTKRIVDSLIGDAADASHSENLSVYPIVGQSGLGKTTLARLIYNDERVVDYFQLRMWLCVSEDFSWKRMIISIIELASGKACEDSDPEQLRKTLQDLVRAKRYLLVLDDVLDENPDNWQKLRSVLDCGAKGASILVTTQLLNVANIMRTVPSQELSKLSDNDCWELFKHRAFEPNEVEPMELVEMGKQIVKKCGGVPLAAKALGGLLRFNRNIGEWFNVMENGIIWSLNNDHLSPLMLSYLKLPVKLKRCFAYCALFPRDEKIDKQYLIELWIANEFISYDWRLDVEDVGDEVWNELYCKSFFEDIERDEFGKVTSFKMNDHVHDLAKFVAEDVCCLTSEKDVTALSERIHHVSDCKWMPGPVQSHQVESLRTYIFLYNYSEKSSFLGDNCVKLSPHVLKCHSLRVLHGEGIENLSSSIGDLNHLRYLNLSRGHFETLPESIGKLWNLQILKLDDCRRLGKLPNSLISLKALQQLSLTGCKTLSSLPARIGQMTSLRILSTFIVGKERGCFLGELGPLKLKGGLQIKHLENVKSVKDAEEALMSSRQLNKLRLSWGNNEESKLQENVEKILEVLQPDTQQLQSLIVEGYKCAHFPQWISSQSLICLTYLELSNCESCLQLPVLGKLLSLRKLYIYRVVHVKFIIEECYNGEGAFMALEYLKLERLPNLMGLSRDDGENMFPCLSTLEVKGCPKFFAEEILLQGFPPLKKLELEGCVNLNVLANFQYQTCLKHLAISSCIQVEGLHNALQHMTALQELLLSDLPNLESLPDCFGNLPLLRNLHIVNCDMLSCLPMSLGSLENIEVYCGP